MVVVAPTLLRRQVVRRTVVDHPAAADHDRPGHQSGQRRQLVGDDEQRGALLRQTAEDRGEDLLVPGVHPRGGFVEDEEVGLRGQGAGDEHAALLTAVSILGGTVLSLLVKLAFERDRVTLSVRNMEAGQAVEELEIDYDGREVLVPFVIDFVPEIDLGEQTLTITPPEGLLDV